MTGILAFLIDLAVPPEAANISPALLRAWANSTNPVLSDTLKIAKLQRLPLSIKNSRTKHR